MVIDAEVLMTILIVFLFVISPWLMAFLLSKLIKNDDSCIIK